MCAPRPSTKRPWSLRDRLDEHDIADLITAYRQGATAAVHGLSLKRQAPPDAERLSCIDPSSSTAPGENERWRLTGHQRNS